MPLPALIVALPVNRFPNKLAPKEPNKTDLNGPLTNFEIQKGPDFNGVYSINNLLKIKDGTCIKNFNEYLNQ